MNNVIQSDNKKIAALIAPFAVVAGVVADYLIHGDSYGLNVFAGAVLLIAGIAFVAIRADVRLDKGACALALCIPVFALCFVIRDQTLLAVVNTLAIVTLFVIVAVRARTGNVEKAGVMEYPLQTFHVLFLTLVGVVPYLRSERPSLQSGHGSQVAASAIRGSLLAIPLLLVFGSLFANADVVFKHYVNQIFSFDLTSVVNHLAWISVLAAIAVGIARVVFTERWERLGGKCPAWLHVGSGELIVALGLVNVLFLSFVAVQFRTLFGGQHYLSTMGISHSAYARTGFFQLLWVTILVLPMLLAFDYVFRSETPSSRRRLTNLSGTLIALLYIVMASAVQRLVLYVHAYGMTVMRFYPLVFMVWLAVVFAWFIATILRGKQDRFAFGAAVAGLVVIAILNVVNPDALIARMNAALPLDRFDPYYHATLSADSAPELCGIALRLSPRRGAFLAQTLLSKWGKPATGDWRSLNLDRTAARAAVGINREALMRIASLPPVPDPMSDRRFADEENATTLAELFAFFCCSVLCAGFVSWAMRLGVQGGSPTTASSSQPAGP